MYKWCTEKGNAFCKITKLADFINKLHVREIRLPSKRSFTARLHGNRADNIVI